MTKTANRRPAQAAAGAEAMTANNGNVHQVDVQERAKAERIYARKVIARSAFTPSERAILTTIVNQWLHHRHGPKRYIHPGREKLAKSAGVKVKTVSRALTKFRAKGFIIDIGNLKGGAGCATRYVVNLSVIWADLAPDNVELKAGDLARMPHRSGTKSGTLGRQNVPLKGGQNVPLSYDRSEPSSGVAGKEEETSEADAEDRA